MVLFIGKHASLTHYDLESNYIQILRIKLAPGGHKGAPFQACYTRETIGWLMKKGEWAFNLAGRILQGDLSLAEGLSFGLARIKAKPISVSLKGIKFAQVDHVLWSILADVFVNHVYLPSNFYIRPTDIVIDIGAHRGGFTSFAAQRTSNTVFAMIKGDYKLIWYRGYPGYDNVYELYNLKTDPEELLDLSKSHPEILLSMGNELQMRLTERDQSYGIKS